VGGRGPGESKLEIDRRRAKDRIAALEARVAELGRQRAVRRARRVAAEVPHAVVVGYTNAGKSTLLNALTGSHVVAEDKLFATLDPTTRRLSFAEGATVVLTDTVGFIRDLPTALVPAFKATLEEVAEASARIHVVDVSTAGWETRIAAVEQVIAEVGAAEGPTILVFNKSDLVADTEQLRWLARRWDAVVVSAADPASLGPLRARLEAVAREGGGGRAGLAPERDDADGADTAWPDGAD
jgi:GTP-binding protein HflX